MRPYLLAAAFVTLSSPVLAASPADPAAPAPAPPAAAAPPGESVPATSEPPPDAPPPAEAPPPPPPPDEVTVLGNKASKATGSAHVIRREQLDRQRYDDPHQVLTTVPGVYVRGEDGFGLRPNIGIRGAASDRSKKLTLMEDGVLFGPAPYSAPAAYYFPIMARMRAVRVVKGPSAIVYGPQTVGGAIEMLTRDIPATRQGMLDVAVGQFGYSKAHLTYGASDEHAGFLIEGVRLANSGFKTVDGDPGADTGFVRNEWMAKAGYSLDLGGPTHHEISLKLGYSDEVSNETYLGLTDADFRASPYRRYSTSRGDQMKWHRTQIAATHRAVLPSGFTVETTVYRHDLKRIWNRVKSLNGASILDALSRPELGNNRHYYGVISGREDSLGSDDTVTYGPNDRAFISQGIQTTLKLQGKTGPVEHRVEYGMRLHYDEIRRLQSEDPARVVQGQLVPSGDAQRVTDNNLASTTALAFHVFDQIAYKRFLLAPGVRVELIQPSLIDYLDSGRRSRRAYQVVAPGVGTYVALTQELGVLAGVHRGFSPAPPEADNKTKPEQSVNYEAGARYDSKSLRAEVIGFFNDYQNLTDICTFSNGCLASNLDRQIDAGGVHIYGVEAFVEGKIKLTPVYSVPVRAAYTLTRTEFLTSFTAADTFFGNVVKGDELPYVPRHQASGSVGVESKRWGVNVNGTYVSAMREQAGGSPERVFSDDTPKTDSYFLLDASGSLKVFKNLTFYLNGRNLLDTAYISARRPFGARPGAPRWVQAGMQISFN